MTYLCMYCVCVYLGGTLVQDVPLLRVHTSIVCVSMYVLRMCVYRWYTCAEVNEMSNYFESTPL